MKCARPHDFRFENFHFVFVKAISVTGSKQKSNLARVPTRSRPKNVVLSGVCYYLIYSYTNLFLFDLFNKLITKSDRKLNKRTSVVIAPGILKSISIEVGY